MGICEKSASASHERHFSQDAGEETVETLEEINIHWVNMQQDTKYNFLRDHLYE